MLNFKKQSIFKRNAEEENKPEPKGGVLAVWGSPESGKTTTAVKIAKHLADKKKNTVLLLCDMTCPMLPCICPPSELECEKSLGSILAAVHVTAPLVKNNLITHKKQPYLTIAGLLKGENEYTYPQYSKVQAQELISALREIAPYIIIDCTSYIANDILSAVALMESDYVIRLAGCDLKSISYFSSQLPLMSDSSWEIDNQYKVISNIKPNQSIEQMDKALGKISFKLPNSKELEEQYLSGNLLEGLSFKESRQFKREIDKIIKEVFEL